MIRHLNFYYLFNNKKMDKDYIDHKKKEYEELCRSEKEIKDSLGNPNNFDGKYKKYYLLNNNWYQEYKKYLIDLCFGKSFQKYNYNVNSLKLDREQKIYCFINKNYTFDFIINYMIVTENFVNLLLDNFDIEEEKDVIYKNKWNIIIGSQCIIINDQQYHNTTYITYS